MFYSDYLDYWMKEYFEINYKYSTARRYKETFGTIKHEIGMYKLNAITPYLLNPKNFNKHLIGISSKKDKASFEDVMNDYLNGKESDSKVSI